MEHFGWGSCRRAVFSKRVSWKVATKGLGKEGKKREMEVSRGVRAFVSAKSIAGSIGTFWIEGKGKKPKEKNKK